MYSKRNDWFNGLRGTEACIFSHSRSLRKWKPSKSSNKRVKAKFCITVCSCQVQRPIKHSACFSCGKEYEVQQYILHLRRGYPSISQSRKLYKYGKLPYRHGAVFHFLVLGNHLGYLPLLSHKIQLACCHQSNGPVMVHEISRWLIICRHIMTESKKVDIGLGQDSKFVLAMQKQTAFDPFYWLRLSKTQLPYQ